MTRIAIAFLLFASSSLQAAKDFDWYSAQQIYQSGRAPLASDVMGTYVMIAATGDSRYFQEGDFNLYGVKNADGTPRNLLTFSRNLRYPVGPVGPVGAPQIMFLFRNLGDKDGNMPEARPVEFYGETIRLRVSLPYDSSKGPWRGSYTRYCRLVAGYSDRLICKVRYSYLQDVGYAFEAYRKWIVPPVTPRPPSTLDQPSARPLQPYVTE